MQEKVLYANYFPFTLDINKQKIQTYSINWEPALNTSDLLSEDNKFLLGKIAKLLSARDENKEPISFNKDHQFHMMINYRVYSNKLIKDYSKEIGSISMKDVEYKATVVYKEELDYQSDEARQVIGRLVKRFMQCIKLVKYGRKYFNPNKRFDFAQHELSLMQGYDSAITIKGERILLQVDSCIKMVRSESMMNVIKNIKPDTEDYATLCGGIVSANYGDHQFYRVSEIDYSVTPLSTFTVTFGKEAGKEQTYMDYYKQRYNLEIKNPNQPLIKSIRKRRGVEQELYLIPELCLPTGETMKQKQDFRLQKELGNVKFVNAAKKIQQSKDFCDALKTSNQQHMDAWGVTLDTQPLEVPYQKIPPGALQLAKTQIDIETGDLDRGTQAQMLKLPFQVGLDRVMVLYNARSKQMCDSFLNTFQQSVEFMKFNINNQPRCIAVNETKGFQSWRETIDANPGAQLIICILPGPKKKGKHYNELKLYLTSVVGVFSQMILESTIKNDRGLRVVCNKLILKITSKTGGIPYKITDVPDRFAQQPTMVCGIDIFHQRSHGKQSVLGFVSTVDSNYGKYFSEHALMNDDQDIAKNLSTVMRNAIDAFGRANKISPKNIVIFRDGVSFGQIQVLKDNEIKAIEHGINSWGERTKNTKLAYVIVNKRITTKFFTANKGNLDSAASATSGTLIKDTEVNDNGDDYYIVSQKAKQGVATPTHYRVIHNELPEDQTNGMQVKQTIEDLQWLTYKLCYLYYNCTHAIKIPAPSKLAHRLSNFVGEKYKVNQPDTFITPKQEILSHNSLWFL